MIIRKGDRVEFIDISPSGLRRDKVCEGVVVIKCRDEYWLMGYWIKDKNGELYNVRKWKIIRKLKAEKTISQIGQIGVNPPPNFSRPTFPQPTYPRPERR